MEYNIEDCVSNRIALEVQRERSPNTSKDTGLIAEMIIHEARINYTVAVNINRLACSNQI